ncbi:MAG: hypothetical protein ACR5K4_03895 [Sodalis sp. (in: enterobacteria)]
MMTQPCVEQDQYVFARLYGVVLPLSSCYHYGTFGKKPVLRFDVAR